MPNARTRVLHFWKRCITHWTMRSVIQPSKEWPRILWFFPSLSFFQNKFFGCSLQQLPQLNIHLNHNLCFGWKCTDFIRSRDPDARTKVMPTKENKIIQPIFDVSDLLSSWGSLFSKKEKKAFQHSLRLSFYFHNGLHIYGVFGAVIKQQFAL